MLQAGPVENKKFSEIEIKSMVLSRREFRLVCPVVTAEFTVGRGARRADLVLLAEEMIAFEIKSDFDSLARFRQQSEEFLKHFDKVILATTSKHLKRALNLCPKAVGIWIVCSNGTLEAVRDAKPVTNLKSCDLASILTKAEKHRFLASTDYKEINGLPIDVVRGAVREAFRSRYKDVSANFWRQSAEQGIVTPDMLPKLSRFAAVRDATTLRELENARYWTEWNASASAFFRSGVTLDV